MTIDHVKAHDEHLVERYLLQEMAADEAEAFELHFFECKECAMAVEDGQILQANGRAVMAEGWSRESEKSLWRSLVKWWNAPMVLVPVSASLLLISAIALYQGTVTIPALRQARVLPAFQLIGASRGAATEIAIQKNAPSFAISVDIPPDAQYPQYVCELGSGSAQIFTLTAPAPGAGQPITILVPAQGLHAGQFQLTVFGTGSTDTRNTSTVALYSDGQRREKVSTVSFDLHFIQ
jgi:hypothetical protein